VWNDEDGRDLEGIGRDLMDVLFQHFPRGIKEYHNKPQNSRCVWFVEAPCYKLDGRGFDSRCHLIFYLT
jgi:hypothetical protein